MSTFVVTDTTAGLPAEFVQTHEVAVLPQIVIFGDRSYRDDTELDTKTFLKMLKESPVLPKTAAPPPAMYTPIFEQALSKYGSVLVITPTADASGTYRSAMTAAVDFPEKDIRVFDCRTLAGPMATMVKLAVQWAEEGEKIDEIINRLQGMSAQQHALFLVNTLEYLHKGGRIGGAQALIGSILQLQPILQLKNGRVEPLETQRTHRKALQRLEEIVVASYPKKSEGYLSIMHSGAGKEEIEEAERLSSDLCAKLNVDRAELYILPPAVLVHGGPGILAVGWFDG